MEVWLFSLMYLFGNYISSALTHIGSTVSDTKNSSGYWMRNVSPTQLINEVVHYFFRTQRSAAPDCFCWRCSNGAQVKGCEWV